MVHPIGYFGVRVPELQKPISIENETVGVPLDALSFFFGIQLAGSIDCSFYDLLNLLREGLRRVPYELAIVWIVHMHQDIMSEKITVTHNINAVVAWDLGVIAFPTEGLDMLVPVGYNDMGIQLQLQPLAIGRLYQEAVRKVYVGSRAVESVEHEFHQHGVC